MALCACAAGAPENLTDALTADSWKAELSEGTSAVYTFAADGTYTVDETENAAAVHLQYENVQYIVDIVCTKDAQGYHLSIAGCDLQPVRAAK